jgi:hypothetical protein
MVAQLALVEDIAARTGFAVAIAHPRPATLDVIGPWLTSAPARGFKLDTVEALSRLEAAWNPARRVAARRSGLSGRRRPRRLRRKQGRAESRLTALR